MCLEKEEEEGRKIILLSSMDELEMFSGTTVLLN